MAHRNDSVSFISSLRGHRKAKKEENPIKELKTDADKKRFIKRKLEAVSVFSLVYSVKMLIHSSSKGPIDINKNYFRKGPYIPEDTKESEEDYEYKSHKNYTKNFMNVNQFMKNLFEEYITDRGKKGELGVGGYTNWKSSFCDGIFKIVNATVLGTSNKIEDYCYMIQKGKWIPWNEVKLNQHATVTPGLDVERFDKSELTRLNCVNKKSMIHALTTDNSDHVVFINLDETILVETKNMKMITYFADYFLAYNQNLMLISDH